jgi:serine/threonine protein kinase
MNQSSLEHPAPSRLSDFISGQLGDAESAEIEAHLADCDVCCAVLEKMPEDSLSGLLKSFTMVEAENTTPWEAASQPNTGPGDPNSTQGLAKSVVAPARFEIPPKLADHPRYRVLGLLGVGGMGAVYKAEHRRMERLVALKVIGQKRINSPGAVERFRREAKAAAGLSHPNIVTAYDADQAGDVHFLVMEFVEGKSLAQVVAESGPVPIPQACDYARQAALGLQHACDRGMVHRDIKPHNLMLTPQGQVKILDFGLARFVREIDHSERHLSVDASNGVAEGAGAEAFTCSGQIIGTADYIAPEQGRDAHQADIRSDIYSLGCTLYYLLAGHSPFAGGSLTEKLAAHGEQTPKSLTAIRVDLPAELRPIIERMLAKDPANRFQAPAEVAEALAPFANASFQIRRRPWGFPTRRSAIIAASVLGPLLLALCIALVPKLQFRSAPDCIQAGSQWKGYFRFLPPIMGYTGNILVSITERRGNTFKGTYATEDAQYEWEIEGTLDQGTIRWEFTHIVREKAPTHVVGSAIVEGHYEGRNMELRFQHPYDNSEAELLMVQVK